MTVAQPFLTLKTRQAVIKVQLYYNSAAYQPKIKGICFLYVYNRLCVCTGNVALFKNNDWFVGNR